MTRLFLSVVCTFDRPVLDQPVDKTDFAYARGKSHWSILHLLTNGLWKMPANAVLFRSMWCLFLTNHFFLSCALCSSYRAELCSILRNENQPHLDLFSLVCDGAQGFIVGVIFVFSRANGKPHRSIRAQKMALSHDRHYLSRKYSPVRLLHFFIQVMGYRRSSQTPDLLCETVK